MERPTSPHNKREARTPPRDEQHVRGTREYVCREGAEKAYAYVPVGALAKKAAKDSPGRL